MKKKGTDYTKSKKESKLSEKYNTISFKEEDGEFYTEGYIATTHPDKVGDKILQETLYNWAEEINSSDDLDANPLSIHHDRGDTTVAGLGTTAEVVKLEDDNYGLKVKTHHNKTHNDFDNTKYQLDNKFLTHYSIEYDTMDGATTHKEGEYRVIEPDTKLYGFGLASPRTVVNKEAKIITAGYKELCHIPESSIKPTQEENKMKEKKEQVPVEEKPAEEKPAEPAPEPEAKPAEDTADKTEGQKESVKSIAVELKEQILTEIKEDLKSMKPANSPINNTGQKMPERKELELKEVEFKEKHIAFKESVLQNKADIESQAYACKEMEDWHFDHGITLGNERMDKNPHTRGVPFQIKGNVSRMYEGKEVAFGTHNKIELKENKLELKDVQTDTDYSGGQTTYVAALANYEQSPARYNDIYGPFIVNNLNDETTTWNLLKKDNLSGASSITARIRTARNATADTYAYGSTPGWDSNVTIKKINLHFVTSYVEVQAEDEAMVLAQGQGGIDVYANEVKYSALDLMDYLNQSQIFGTGDGTSETESLGFEHLVKTHGGGATTLYGRTRNAAGFTTLDSGGYDNMSSASITLKKIREMIRTVVKNGAKRKNLVLITSLLQHDFIKALIQSMQRIVPTSARVGFTGMIEFDGVPVFADADLDDASKTDDLYLIDTEHTRIKMKKVPTYVEFAKVSLHRRGIIWMMWNLFSDAPNHNYWIYGLATS